MVLDLQSRQWVSRICLDIVQALRLEIAHANTVRHAAVNEALHGFPGFANGDIVWGYGAGIVHPPCLELLVWFYWGYVGGSYWVLADRRVDVLQCAGEVH